MEMREQEERLKERVYSHFENELADLTALAEQSHKYVLSGAYDDQDRFMAYSQASKHREQKEELRKAYLAVYSSPYFAHMGLRNEDGAVEHMLLSDCADLDQVICVGADAYLVPFKQSKDRPMLTTLFHEYQNCKAETFSVRHDVGPDREPFEEELTVTLIRNVKIDRRQILGITQLIPRMASDETFELPTADAVLARRLEENRSDAKLRNIIATLQREQFDIIRYDLNRSFVVQGCAGSGKTQCLIHRLFFLRDSVGEIGWDKVLLITPSQLFRNYSMELMRRYHLAGISNCSLSQFYVSLLQAYDHRFKNRQYEFELTEEYLPDEYLSRVYSEENIEIIKTEISNAVSGYVRESCSLLETDYPSEPINDAAISILAAQIDERIAAFDKNAELYENNPDYKANLDRLDALDKEKASLQKRLASIESTAEDIAERKADFQKFEFELHKAKEELDEWRKISRSESERRQQSLRRFVQEFGSVRNPSVGLQLQYGRELASALSVFEPLGLKYKLDRENEEFLQKIYELAKSEYLEFLNGKDEKAWLHRLKDRERNNKRQLENVLEQLRETAEEADSVSAWLREYSQKGSRIETQRTTYRAALERSRYFLGRIESSVFEKEVWSALAPLKTACGIAAVKTERMSNGHERQTRILYKSDLLFYLMIYESLHGTNGIPDYRFICVDEGQDLHAADYRMIRKLYPKAELNVFGDTSQVLHQACGISDWATETGIPKVFKLNNNYRNAPEIVAYCNSETGSDMTFFGSLRPDNAPRVLRSVTEIRSEIASRKPAIIVKSSEEYKALCAAAGLTPDSIEYLDMNSDSETSGKLHCYSIYAAKGLEFKNVLVYTANMSKNQKIVAFTRALERLCICNQRENEKL